VKRPTSGTLKKTTRMRVRLAVAVVLAFVANWSRSTIDWLTVWRQPRCRFAKDTKTEARALWIWAIAELPN
jgi:hypothetical protein